jgi:hypothetical protein
MTSSRGILRKILIGAGACLLISMMALATFSFGVYVGHEGLLVGSLEAFGSRAAPDQAPPQAPRRDGQDLPPGRPALTGKVGGITNEGLFVRAPQGLRLVEVDEETLVQDHQGRSLEITALRQGMYVAVFGQFSGDGRSLMADTIVLVPSPQP